MVDETNTQDSENISDEDMIIRLASAMKDNAPSQEDKQNVHTFLLNVVQEDKIDKISKVGNLRDDKVINELGKPKWTARGSLRMALVSDKIMDNEFFTDFFNADAMITFNTSLSREGFLVKQATTSTKQVADATRRRKTSSGIFRKNIEEYGGDINSPPRNE